MNLHSPSAAQEPRARTTDPETSHAAARSVTKLTAKQEAVVKVLRALGPATDQTLVLSYRDMSQGGQVPQQSESGVRTRRNELASMEPARVVRVGTVKLPSGRRAILWKVAE